MKGQDWGTAKQATAPSLDFPKNRNWEGGRGNIPYTNTKNYFQNKFYHPE
jgi:hypothetical protein